MFLKSIMNEDTTFTPEEHRKLQIIISKAIKMEEEQSRNSFIDKECGGNERISAYAKKRAGYLIERKKSNKQKKLAENIQENSQDPLIGKKINNYEIIEKLGSGGFGSVYLAEHVDLNVLAAIKIFTKKDDKIILSWIKESKTLERFFNLGHDNIIRFIGASLNDEEYPYIITEYVDGLPIGKYCEEEKPVLTDFLRLFRELCKAIHFLHINHVSHLDLKSENILVTKENTQIKVIDFGASRLVRYGRISKHTFSFNPLSFIYASPEQIRKAIQEETVINEPASKEKEELNQKSDIYSLGALLYFLITKKPPIDISNSVSYLENILDKNHKPIYPSKKVLDLAEKNSKLSPEELSQKLQGNTEKNFKLSPEELSQKLQGDIDFIIMKCLEKDKGDRYKNVQEIEQDLSCFLKGKPLISKKDSSLYTVSKWITRALGIKPGRVGLDKWTQPILRSVGLILLSILLTGFSFFSIREMRKWWVSQQPIAKKLNPEIKPTKLRLNQWICDEKTKECGFAEKEIDRNFLEVLCEEKNCFTFFRIPSGSFQMGRRENENFYMESIASKDIISLNNKEKSTIQNASKKVTEQESDDQKHAEPRHNVTLSNEIYMTRFEITKKQWNQVAKGSQNINLPISKEEDDLPKTNISYKQAKLFCETLSQSLSKTHGETIKVRLPTEAEWEYSCRAGNQDTKFGSENSFNDRFINSVFYDSQTPYWAVQIIKASKHPLPPSQFIGNEFALSGMNGNVWEMVSDSWHDSYDVEKDGKRNTAPNDGTSWEEIDISLSNDEKSYVMRGGAFSRDAYMAQCSYRAEGRYGSAGNDQVGFRIVLEKTEGLSKVIPSLASLSK